MNSLFTAVVLCILAAAVLAQQFVEDSPSADKRMRSFAFAKRASGRALSFAKRSDESDPESLETVEEKRARFAFAKRSPYRQFAFAKRGGMNRFAFAKRARFAFA